MTYRELMAELAKLSNEQLDQEVTVYDCWKKETFEGVGFDAEDDDERGPHLFIPS